MAQHLLTRTADADHNRSVFTLVGSEEELAEALLAGIRVALERIDLRTHDGAHPCIGAADVVPLVPIVPILGILICGYMMTSLPWATWERLIVWMIIGLGIYFFYSRSHSKLARAEGSA